MSVSSDNDSDNDSSSSSNSSNNENKFINIQKEKMQVLKQKSAILLILTNQHSQVSQLNSIKSFIVENVTCRFLYTL